MALDLFGNIDEISEEELHPKYKLLRDKYFYEEERKIILDWTDDFIDRDNKIVKEFQTTFYSSFWEFYLYKVFREMNFEIDFTYDRTKRNIEVFWLLNSLSPDHNTISNFRRDNGKAIKKVFREKPTTMTARQ